MSADTSPLRFSAHDEPVNVLHEVDASTATTGSTLSSATLVGGGLPTLPGANQPTSARQWVSNPPTSDKARARTLVLCFDGTGDQFDDDNSNVIQFLTCLKKDDQRFQLVYYQSGIGTYTKDSSASPIISQVSEVLDEMFAWNLAAHVQGGYEFLMQNYTAGDKIAIFGFSRGAYTARALAGMIQKVGLLPVSNAEQIPFAWAMYTRDDVKGMKSSEGFKKTFSIDVTIDFVGVWETVASVGMTNKVLPFVKNNTAIRVFRHALALDERRAKFMPNFYHASDVTDTAATATTGGKSTETIAEAAPLRKKMPRFRSASQMWEDEMNAHGKPTDVLEVWFSGCHCDIGGGSVANGTRNSLARIPLRWMIRECFKSRTGIIFDAQYLKDICGLDAATLGDEKRPPRISPDSTRTIATSGSGGLAIVSFLRFLGSVIAIPLQFLWNVVSAPFKYAWAMIRYSKLFGNKTTKASNAPAAPTPPPTPLAPVKPFVSEEVEELDDAMCAKYDQLELRWGWWILEYWPTKHINQKGKRDDYFVRCNMGEGRKIYGDARANGLRVHRSVKTRLEVLDKKTGASAYEPKAWYNERDAQTGAKVKHMTIRNIDRPDAHEQWQWVD